MGRKVTTFGRLYEKLKAKLRGVFYPSNRAASLPLPLNELFADFPVELAFTAIDAWTLAWQEGEPSHFCSIMEFSAWLHKQALDRADLERVSADGNWTKTDAQIWKAFIGSSTGMRLRSRLHELERRNAIASCEDAMHTAHSAGRSAGFTDCLKYIYSLTYTFDRAKVAEQRQENADQRAEREMLERIGAL